MALWQLVGDRFPPLTGRDFLWWVRSAERSGSVARGNGGDAATDPEDNTATGVMVGGFAPKGCGAGFAVQQAGFGWDKLVRGNRLGWWR